MRTCIFIPPVKRPTGGVAVFYQMARHLMAAGYDVRMVPLEGDGPELYQDPGIPVLRWNDLDLTPDDIWLIPEGWPNVLAPGLKAGARCKVYVQNWAYLFSALPQGVHWNSLQADLFAVSHPVAWFIEQTTGRTCPILRPGIDPERFRAPLGKGHVPLHNGDAVRIAFMPRKNKALAERIKNVFDARMALNPSPPKVRWAAIDNMPHDQVADVLARADIFLATGFPEGCPLPPLEAMASGCVVVGWGGLGGWDYMRQAPQDNPAAQVAPWWPLRPTAWDDTGNGLWSQDADVVAAGLALEEAVHWRATGDPRFTDTVKAATFTASHYTTDIQAKAVVELWKSFE